MTSSTSLETAVPVEPPITVVVPTHGRTDLFLQTLDSLRLQTLDSFELIVTDDSPAQADRLLIQDAVLSYHHQTGRTARYLCSEPSLGQARNTNQGLREARGRLVRILHSDDLLAPHALETEVALMSDTRLNLDVLHHTVEAFRTRPRLDQQPRLSLVQPSLLFRSVLHSGTPLPSATVFRRSVLEAVGGMREDLDFLCDWEFVSRLVIDAHQRQRFIGMLSQGLVGWRTHADSTTGRLWHRHFLEHEAFIAGLQAAPALTESLIGDRGTVDGFFASAVRYRYRRLHADVAAMTLGQLVRAVPMILRCLCSPASVRERIRPAPWTPRGSRNYPQLVVPHEAAPDASVRPTVGAASPAKRRREPREGWRYFVEAKVAGAIIRRARAAAKARAGQPAPIEPIAGGRPGPAGPVVLEPVPAPPAIAGARVEIRPSMSGVPAPAGTVTIQTEYNNSINLWPVRGLLSEAGEIVVTQVNANAFVEPVLHHCLKFAPVGATIEVPIADNQHLTSFGFKSLLEKLFPGAFTWAEQFRHGPAHHVLRYRRQRLGHETYTAAHTGWTFGMLTTGTRLENVTRFVDSIERHCAEPYEILIVSPVELGELETRPGVRVLRFDERDDLGWITRKKNLICAEAAYSDILICHDRFWLDERFVETFAGWGYAYGLAAVRVRLPDGQRGLDWAVVSSQNHVWSAGGLLDYRAYSQYAYNPGGATVIRKAFWRDFPWNENLFWNEHEDVELCRRVQRAGGLIALSAATLIAAEDRWIKANPRIPYCDQNEVLYGSPVGEQRIRFLPKEHAA